MTTILGFCRRTSSPVSSIIFYFNTSSSLTLTLTFEVPQLVSTYFRVSFPLKHTEDLSLQINNTRGDLYNSRIRLDYWLDGWFGPRSAWVCRGWWELQLWCLKDNAKEMFGSPIYEIKWGTCSELMASFLKTWSQKVDFFTAHTVAFAQITLTDQQNWLRYTVQRGFKQTSTKISPKWVIIAIRALPQLVK